MANTPTTLYVCGPMSGLPGLNFEAFFEADRDLTAAGYTVLNPADRAGRTPDMPWEWYLRRCIKDVVDADGLALLSGHHFSRGARLEVAVASGLDMPATTVEDWLSLATTHAAKEQ